MDATAESPAATQIPPVEAAPTTPAPEPTTQPAPTAELNTNGIPTPVFPAEPSAQGVMDKAVLEDAQKKVEERNKTAQEEITRVNSPEFAQQAQALGAAKDERTATQAQQPAQPQSFWDGVKSLIGLK